MQVQVRQRRPTTDGVPSSHRRDNLERSLRRPPVGHTSGPYRDVRRLPEKT